MSSGHLLFSGDAGWVRVIGFWVMFLELEGRKVKSRECALASDLVKARAHGSSRAASSFMLHLSYVRDQANVRTTSGIRERLGLGVGGKNSG